MPLTCLAQDQVGNSEVQFLTVSDFPLCVSPSPFIIIEGYNKSNLGFAAISLRMVYIAVTYHND